MKRVLPVLLLLSACQRQEIDIGASRQEDHFVQNALRELDVLLVVDSSGSMVDEQEKLSVNFESFIHAFADADVDYHIGVVTTDLGNLEEAGQLRGSPTVITPETPSADGAFAANVMVGTEGSGLEMGLEAARLALTAPLVSTTNAGFLRSNAALSIVIFSDEDDMSPYPVDDYLNLFASLKGEIAYRDPTYMNLSAVVGDVPFGCESSDGQQAYAGTRYVDAALKTGGVVASICTSDFGPLVDALGLNISGLHDEFVLSRCPKVSTLEVTAGGRLEPEGIAFSYVPEEKLLRFFSGWVPLPGEDVVATYEFYPEDSLPCPDE